MIKIILVDDHAIVRKGIKALLEEEKDIQILGEADNYADVFTLLDKELPDLVMLDVDIPGRNGFEILKDIKVLYPPLKVLILSMQSEDQFGLRAIKAGAYGYISKDNSNEELRNAVRRVYEGRKYISSSVMEQLADVYDKGTDKPAHELLSDRELQILCMISSGKPVTAIAGELSLSPATIATYRSRVLKKLRLKSNVEMTAYAIRNHLIS